MADLLATARAARACTLCVAHLPLGPNPVFQVGAGARLLIAAQAPGRKVHETGITFNDPSGERLRNWLGVDRSTFYDAGQIAILPMAFCYPGKGKSGDLPPRAECARKWRHQFIDNLHNLQLTLVIGQYAHKWHLEKRYPNLTETVRNWRSYAPSIVPLPHPSPRNNLWLRKNPWFEEDLIPELRIRVRSVLGSF